MNEKLKSILMQDEGLKLKFYTDSAGIPTIGVGRNLRDTGITTEEAMYLLNNDIAIARAKACVFPWFKDLSENRQAVIISMIFNMGIGGLLEFKSMLSAAECGNYQQAAAEMLNSHWATQVGDRAKRLADLMESG